MTSLEESLKEAIHGRGWCCDMQLALLFEPIVQRKKNSPKKIGIKPMLSLGNLVTLPRRSSRILVQFVFHFFNRVGQRKIMVETKVFKLEKGNWSLMFSLGNL
jgi:hypothetical protein